MDCKKELDRANNGGFMEAMARLHIKETGHKVIVGYEYKMEIEK